MLVKVSLLSTGYRLSWEYLLSWNTLRVSGRFCNYKRSLLGDKITSDHSFNQFPPQWNTLTFPSCKKESEWLQWAQNKAGSLQSETSNRACEKSDPHFMTRKEGRKKKKISVVIFQVSFVWLPETASFRGTAESYWFPYLWIKRLVDLGEATSQKNKYKHLYEMED